MSQSERLEEINDVLTLLADMEVEGGRVKAILKTHPYTGSGGSSAFLHEHVLVDGSEVSRNRKVKMEVASLALENHWVIPRPKSGGLVSPNELILSLKGRVHLRRLKAEKK